MSSVLALHCCSVHESQSLLLACDASATDVISSVAFASFGASDFRGNTCGKEVLHPCGAPVDAIIKARCVGLRTCRVDATILGNPCPLAAGRRILTARWNCSQDGLTQKAPVSKLPNLPLRVQGTAIVDANGQRLRLRGVNWSGSHEWRQVPAGLDIAPLESIVRRVREMGFNFIRLTFALETWKNNPVVGDHTLAANPSLQGLRALTILDRVVSALGKEGLMVWLDNHMLDADWCCHDQDCNGMWFNARHTADDWVAMWKSISRRYSNTSAVVGVGLKNEPHRVCSGRGWGGEGVNCKLDFLNLSVDAACVEPQWSSGPQHLQYKTAVEKAGRAVLSESPHMLVSACGLDYATDLKSMGADLPDLPRTNFVLEAHEYPWHHPRHVVMQSFESHACVLDSHWGHILRNGVAPVIMSEFGMSHTWNQDEFNQQWLRNLAAYVQQDGPLGNEGGLDWAYWQLSGLQVSGTSRHEGDVETFGVMNECWTGPAALAHIAAIQQLMEVPSTSRVDWKNLNCADHMGGSFSTSKFLTWKAVLAAVGLGIFVIITSLLLFVGLRRRLRKAAITSRKESED